MSRTITADECKKKLFKLGIKLGVSPSLISTRLLSKEDKEDMVNGLIPDESLETAVRVWMENGMPDYANGKTDPYKPSPEQPMQRYRGNGDYGKGKRFAR